MASEVKKRKVDDINNEAPRKKSKVRSSNMLLLLRHLKITGFELFQISVL